MKTLSQARLKERLAKIRLLALDVDGVLTDGGLYYSGSGEELKKFNVKDGLGLKHVMQRGIAVAIISSSNSEATLHRASKLGIIHVYIGVEDKPSKLCLLCEQLGIELSQVAYMGDDLVDLAVMKAVGCPISVADAVIPVQEASVYVTSKLGGQGAVREICDLLNL